jgi:hypothetical protein
MAGRELCVLVTIPPIFPEADEAVTERNNFIDLVSELRAGVMGQYYLESWYKLGELNGHDLPRKTSQPLAY